MGKGVIQALYVGKVRRLYICQIDGGQSSSSEEDVQECDWDSINDAIASTVIRQALLPVGGISSVHGTVGILTPVTVKYE